MIECLFNFKCYEIGYAELSEKATLSRNTYPLKGSTSEKVAVQNKRRFGKVHTFKNYLFWRKGLSETVAVLESIYPQEKAD